MDDTQKAALLLAGSALAAAWWFLSRQSEQGSPADTGGPSESSGNVFTDAASVVSNVLTPVSIAMSDPNVQAFLMLIRTGEGTADAGGYSRLFGGGSFSGFADHPRQLVTRSGLSSTAAGAYQILSRTWDELGLPDFSPASQDEAAVKLIKRRGALADVIAGRFVVAIAKCNKEWASLPGSPYGQPTLSLDKANQVLLAYGAQPATGALA